MNQHRSLSSSSALLFAIALITSATQSAAQNLLVNGDFDAGVSPWAGVNDNVTVISRTSTGNDLAGGSGPGSMEVQFRSWNGTAGGAFQDVEVVEGTVYQFSGAYFSPSGDNVSLGVRVFAYWQNDSGQTVSFDQITDYPPLVDDHWTPLTGSVTVPEGIHTARIIVAVQNPSSASETRPGIALFDDLWLAPSGLASAIQELFVPAAASTPGSGGTFWTTSAWVSNLSDSAVVVRGAALLQGQANDDAIAHPMDVGTVDSGGFLRVDDVYHALGADGATGGLFLEVTADGELPYTRLVSVATYTSTPNRTGAGAYGQGIPATGPGAAAEVVCPGITDNGSHRANIGVLNSSSYAISVAITVTNAVGAVVGTETWSLEPFEQRQQRVTTLGGTGLDGGTATFKLLSSEGSFLAYSSVVDNKTGDAVYVAGD